jgi:hypothetical protein
MLSTDRRQTPLLGHYSTTSPAKEGPRGCGQVIENKKSFLFCFCFFSVLLENLPLQACLDVVCDGRALPPSALRIYVLPYRWGRK